METLLSLVKTLQSYQLNSIMGVFSELLVFKCRHTKMEITKNITIA